MPSSFSTPLYASTIEDFAFLERTEGGHTSAVTPSWQDMTEGGRMFFSRLELLQASTVPNSTVSEDTVASLIPGPQESLPYLSVLRALVVGSAITKEQSEAVAAAIEVKDSSAPASYAVHSLPDYTDEQFLELVAQVYPTVDLWHADAEVFPAARQFLTLMDVLRDNPGLGDSLNPIINKLFVTNGDSVATGVSDVLNILTQIRSVSAVQKHPLFELSTVPDGEELPEHLKLARAAVFEFIDSYSNMRTVSGTAAAHAFSLFKNSNEPKHLGTEVGPDGKVVPLLACSSESEVHDNELLNTIDTPYTIEQSSMLVDMMCMLLCPAHYSISPLLPVYTEKSVSHSSFSVKAEPEGKPFAYHYYNRSSKRVKDASRGMAFSSALEYLLSSKSWRVDALPNTEALAYRALIISRFVAAVRRFVRFLHNYDIVSDTDRCRTLVGAAISSVLFSNPDGSTYSAVRSGDPVVIKSLLFHEISSLWTVSNAKYALVQDEDLIKLLTMYTENIDQLTFGRMSCSGPLTALVLCNDFSEDKEAMHLMCTKFLPDLVCSYPSGNRVASVHMLLTTMYRLAVGEAEYLLHCRERNKHMRRWDPEKSMRISFPHIFGTDRACDDIPELAEVRAIGCASSLPTIARLFSAANIVGSATIADSVNGMARFPRLKTAPRTNLIFRNVQFTSCFIPLKDKNYKGLFPPVALSFQLSNGVSSDTHILFFGLNDLMLPCFYIPKSPVTRSLVSRAYNKPELNYLDGATGIIKEFRLATAKEWKRLLTNVLNALMVLPCPSNDQARVLRATVSASIDMPKLKLAATNVLLIPTDAREVSSDELWGVVSDEARTTSDEDVFYEVSFSPVSLGDGSTNNFNTVSPVNDPLVSALLAEWESKYQGADRNDIVRYLENGLLCGLFAFTY